jgi:tetratricopeptide (TPR) repeat protein/DNA-binding CsgD family transcriptional regulator
MYGKGTIVRVKQWQWWAAWLCFFISSNCSGQYFKIDSLGAELHRSRDTVKVQIMTELSWAYLNINIDSSLLYAKDASVLARKISFAKGEYRALECLLQVYTQLGDLRKRLHVNDELVAVAEALNDKFLLARAKAKLGKTYGYLRMEAKAFDELSQASKIFHELGDNKNRAASAIGIGNIFLEINDFSAARKYYGRAMEWAEQDPTLLNVININLGEIHQKENHHDEAFYYLNKALPYFESISNQNVIAYILMMKGKSFAETGNSEKAAAAFRESLSLNEKTNNQNNTGAVLKEMGYLSLKNQEYPKAVEYFNRALELVEKSGNYHQLEMLYEGLVQGSKAIGDFETALKYEQKVTICKDSLRSASARSKTNELLVKYDLEMREREVGLLKTEKTNQITIVILLISLVALIVVMGFLLIVRYKTKVKLSNTEHVALEATLKARNETEHNLKSELEFKVKELTSFTLHLIQRKEMLMSIKEEIQEIRSKAEGEVSVKLGKIMATISLSQRQDKDWDNFKVYFEQVHQGFFDNLHAMHQELNANDLRLCALIKLNLDTRQIASVMDITPESAKVARHRLRKKLGLTSQDELHGFFSKITSYQPPQTNSESRNIPGESTSSKRHTLV